jgi:hypothetical protein
MYADRPIHRFPIEAAHVTCRLMKAHQPVDMRNRLERVIDGLIDARFARPRCLDLHEGPKQRSGAANPI